ncbi:hypothetical protein O3G_MSEX005001 [Manduca sexta]|uniref:MIF4G domain-containing protein n=1 Tax=Manduca sexta TaxID=7130 RepID=A0A922CIU6_MANSE|nr:hypothetical protein O3G_MSEX005001 [Manduca sexta]
MKKKKAAPRPKFENTRKALRKHKRQEKKVHRKEHYLKKKTLSEQPHYTPGKFVKRPADAQEPNTELKKKKSKLETPLDIVTKEREKERNAAERLKQEMEEQRRKIFLQANEEEDKVIKKLEKQLGLNKAKNKNNYFADDGLDYLLEICDRSTTEQIVAAEKHLANVEADSDFEEDLAVVTGKEIEKSKKKDKKQKGKESHDSLSEESNLESEGDYGEFDDSDDDGDEVGSDEDDYSDEDSEDTNDEPEEKPTKSQKSKAKTNKESMKENKKTEMKPNTKGKEKIISEDDLSKVFSDDEVSHLSGDDDLEGFSGDEEVGDDQEVKEEKEKPDVWEDIYGRKRDKEGNIIKEEKGTYVPPHLRNKDSTSDKDLVQLKRQIKSVLNKLAGTNLHWACTSIENLYSSNSRNSVNTALTQLWLDATVSPAATPDRMVAEHAALVAVMHANVGSEIGAHFLQELTTRFDNMIYKKQPVEDKQLDNLVSCLAHLYSFKILAFESRWKGET